MVVLFSVNKDTPFNSPLVKGGEKQKKANRCQYLVRVEWNGKNHL